MSRSSPPRLQGPGGVGGSAASNEGNGQLYQTRGPPAPRPGPGKRQGRGAEARDGLLGDLEGAAKPEGAPRGSRPRPPATPLALGSARRPHPLALPMWDLDRPDFRLRWSPPRASHRRTKFRSVPRNPLPTGPSPQGSRTHPRLSRRKPPYPWKPRPSPPPPPPSPGP